LLMKFRCKLASFGQGAIKHGFRDGSGWKTRWGQKNTPTPTRVKIICHPHPPPVTGLKSPPHPPPAWVMGTHWVTQTRLQQALRFLDAPRIWLKGEVTAWPGAHAGRRRRTGEGGAHVAVASRPGGSRR
jgi:hypothetical protein